jgi:hypothetical protein
MKTLRTLSIVLSLAAGTACTAPVGSQTNALGGNVAVVDFEDQSITLTVESPVVDELAAQAEARSLSHIARLELLGPDGITVVERPLASLYEEHLFDTLPAWTQAKLLSQLDDRHRLAVEAPE